MTGETTDVAVASMLLRVDGRAGVGTATDAGAKGGGDSSRLYVAASGGPYLLKATGDARKYSGTVTFDDRAPRVHLPPASRIVDIGKPHG